MISPGQQIGGYTVLHLLGRGGMGEVYLGQHRRVSRRAAIKVLVPELSQNAVVVERFFNEARAASLIRHPGIVEILDCDLYMEQAYIVMEYLDGESFGGYLYRTGPLERDLPFFFAVSAAMAGAVGAAHAAGIIHRDLKPDNVYLHLPSATDPSVTVKVLDFGIAKLSQQDGGPSKTSTGVMLGTPSYMSPEQCRGAGRVDSRSDIYSLGCILYEALIGTPPFVREGMGDLIIAHVAEAPEPPSQRLQGLPAGLSELIVRMLAKGADERFQSMDQVVVALRGVAQAGGIVMDGPLRPRLPVERPPAIVEGSQPLPAPSGVETTPLGPRSRPPSGGTVPLEAPGGGASRVGSSPGAQPRRATPSPSVRDVVRDPSKPTTLGSTASELKATTKPPGRTGVWVAIGVGAVLVIGGGVVVMNKRAPQPESTAAVSAPALKPSTTAPSIAPPVIPPAPVPVPSEPPPEPVVAVPVADTVQIDVQGITADTTVLVDGKSSALPIRLPRGAAKHKIVLRAPGEAPRTIQVDGTRDRVVEASLSQKPSGEPATGSHREKPGRHGDRERPVTKTPGAGADREAITDI